MDINIHMSTDKPDDPVLCFLNFPSTQVINSSNIIEMYTSGLNYCKHQPDKDFQSQLFHCGDRLKPKPL